MHDIGSEDGTDYLIMECVEGETLAKRLEKGPLPLEQVLKYGSQIADALDKAHRSGVVHRDLKPGNIMLTPTGAKLLDFGLAKPAAPLVSGTTLTAAVPTSPVTQEGTVIGTFQYMSPEQVEGKEVDGRSEHLFVGHRAVRNGDRQTRLRRQEPAQRCFPNPRKRSAANQQHQAHDANLSDKTLTACTIQFWVSTEGRPQTSMDWDSLV